MKFQFEVTIEADDERTAAIMRDEVAALLHVGWPTANEVRVSVSDAQQVRDCSLFIRANAPDRIGGFEPFSFDL